MMPAIDQHLASAHAWMNKVESISSSQLFAEAKYLRDQGHGLRVNFSRKVFVPLTRLCRDVCGYCTFATSPRNVAAPYLSIDEVLKIANSGKAAGCKEALFTLGDKPELRYPAARRALDAMGFATTVEYLLHVCENVLRETGLLPHVNAGVMTENEIAALRRVSVSQGIMLESISERLCERGGPHFGAPDKNPQLRLDMLEAAGRLSVPFTSGILIGIGETKLEIIASLLALKEAHLRHGHLQEVIVQNFVAKPDTQMRDKLDASHELLMWAAAVARLILGPDMNIQVPPNLSFERYPELLDAGISDWGGISPVTPDHVNPEAPWPQIEALARVTEDAGYHLVERIAAYPVYVLDLQRWQSPELRRNVVAAVDAEGYARGDDWAPGIDMSPPRRSTALALASLQSPKSDTSLVKLLDRAIAGDRLSEGDIVGLFSVRGGGVDQVTHAANALRKSAAGDIVRYVVNRNINYTNVCTYGCKFCAFSKGKTHENLRGQPYDLSLQEIQRRVVEAWDRGATEVCMQGGIHPDYTGDTYVSIVHAVKEAAPDMHVHAFSPLEIQQGAETLGISVSSFLERLLKAGLGSLPGTAAEILDDDVRKVICPDKLSTSEWLGIVETAHRVGLPTTSTIMFGHVESSRSWARHLLAIRDLQERTGGFTEFVPLPFVHMEAPMSLRGHARHGPTWRETILMHAIARLVLHPGIRNIQASWVKLGVAGVGQLLTMGVNDLGGTLMNESISKAAGTQHGQEVPPEAMERLIRQCGRTPMQRSTRYGSVSDGQRSRSFGAPELLPIVLTPLARKSGRIVQERAV
jgi:FO synthase